MSEPAALHVRTRASRALWLAAFTASLLAVPVPAPGAGASEWVARLMAPEEHPLTSYRATRHLVASTRKGKMQGAITAETMLDAGAFRYTVIEEQGSGVIVGKVLKAALQGEQEAIAEGAPQRLGLTPQNYEFLDPSGDLPGVILLPIRPRQHHVMLIDGTVTLDAATGDLLSVEGQPSKRPSFWTRRVRINRRYARINGVRVPVAMESHSDVLIVGASSFAMTYCYDEINGEPLTQEAIASAAPICQR